MEEKRCLRQRTWDDALKKCQKDESTTCTEPVIEATSTEPVFETTAVYEHYTETSSPMPSSGGRGLCRLLDITHMCYEYTPPPPLLPGQLRQARQVELSVTLHTADSKPVTS